MKKMQAKQEIYEKRPTSPHLSIYKPQISSTLSILHRFTGVMMFLALSLIAWYMILIQSTGFCTGIDLNSCIVVKLAMYIISYASIYHFCNGIRHLFWDVGYGFSIKAMNCTGWVVVVLSIFFTFAFWSFIV